MRAAAGRGGRLPALGDVVGRAGPLHDRAAGGARVGAREAQPGVGGVDLHMAVPQVADQPLLVGSAVPVPEDDRAPRRPRRPPCTSRARPAVGCTSRKRPLGTGGAVVGVGLGPGLSAGLSEGLGEAAAEAVEAVGVVAAATAAPRVGSSVSPPMTLRMPPMARPAAAQAASAAQRAFGVRTAGVRDMGLRVAAVRGQGRAGQGVRSGAVGAGAVSAAAPGPVAVGTLAVDRAAVRPAAVGAVSGAADVQGRPRRAAASASRPAARRPPREAGRWWPPGPRRGRQQRGGVPGPRTAGLLRVVGGSPVRPRPSATDPPRAAVRPVTPTRRYGATIVRIDGRGASHGTVRQRAHRQPGERTAGVRPAPRPGRARTGRVPADPGHDPVHRPAVDPGRQAGHHRQEGGVPLHPLPQHHALRGGDRPARSTWTPS